jgi:hypothetical protein
MDNIQNKIIYKKTADYDNISSTTNSVNSQIDLDDSIISIDNNLYNNNDDSIYTNNNNLMYNINKELTKDLKLNQDNNEDKNDEDKDNEDKDDEDKDDEDKDDEDNEMNKIEDFSNIRLNQVINMENVNYNIDREEQNSFLYKLTTNDINTWIFMGMIIISFLIIIMIIINNK